MRSSYRFAVFLLGLVLCVAAAQGALADPIIDGVYDPSEGYANTYTVEFDVTGGSGDTTIGGGYFAWTLNDDGSVSFVAVISESLVDNTYGANASSGWGSSGHTFDNLKGSDKALFRVTDADGDVVFAFEFDYLEYMKDSGTYASKGGKASTGNSAWLVEYQTSLGKNAADSHFASNLGKGSDSPTPGSQYFDDWITAVVYEGRISADAWGSAGFGGIEWLEAHISPSMGGYDHPTTPVLTPVPEPGTLLLVAAGGLVGVVGARRRRRSDRASPASGS